MLALEIENLHKTYASSLGKLHQFAVPSKRDQSDLWRHGQRFRNLRPAEVTFQHVRAALECHSRRTLSIEDDGRLVVDSHVLRPALSRTRQIDECPLIRDDREPKVAERSIQVDLQQARPDTCRSFTDPRASFFTASL